MATAQFDSESEMQAWLRTTLADCDGLASLVVNPNYLNQLSPATYAQKRFSASYKLAWRSLEYNRILTDNENISLAEGEALRPDFLLYGLESESIVVVELKNLPKTTREAGTEIGAYAAEIRSYLPLLSDGDIASVLISTSWPTLLKHFVCNEVMWLGRTVICLEPVKEGAKLALKIKEIDSFLDESPHFKLSPETLGGFCLCLYDYSNKAQGPDNSRLDQYLLQMRAAGAAMASRGNALRSHGFAFLWKDLSESIAAQYCFTIANVASFQGVRQLLVGPPPYQAVNTTHQKLLELLRDFDPQGHGVTLSEIRRYACEYVNDWCTADAENYTDWGTLRDDMYRTPSELLGFYSWGIFAEAFHERLKREYADGNHDTKLDSPYVGLEILNELIEQNIE